MARMRWDVLLGALLVAACASVPPALDDAGLDAAMRRHAVVLFGEIHDSPVGQARRAEAIRRWVDSGARPAIVMEHFDRERQADIDRVLAAPDPTPAKLVEAAGGRGWPWRDLEPVLALAIGHRLPVIAANLSRDDARRVMRQGPAAAGLDAVPVPATVEGAQVEAIIAGHCGQIGPDAARPMAQAQVARDRVMAAAVQRHAARGVVLLAGNGHVRRDVGVPPWLPADLRGRMLVVGTMEGASPLPASAYDVTIDAPAPAREDPCLGLMPRR